jgi:SAM-dependent methyltransferase
VLDVGVGFGRWGVLLREFCGAGKNGNASEGKRLSVVGIEALQTDAAEHARLFYDQIHFGGVTEVIGRINERWDLIILDAVLKEWSAETTEQALGKALGLSDYVLVSSAFGKATVNNGHRRNGHKHPGRLSDLISDNLVRKAILDGPTANQGTAMLLSRTDPKGLRRTNPMQPVFEKMIESNLKVGQESVSGPGSCLAQTAEIRRRLPFLFADLNVKSLLDAPCGDFNWMRHLSLGIDEYVGVDVVPTLVEQNQKQFGNSERRFLNLDITSDYLPQVDLILCRDCLGHLPLGEIAKALRNFKRSQSKYLLTTTFTGTRPNLEIEAGDWRPLNLQLPPFNLPAPFRLINEKCTEVNGIYADKCLGLWRLENLPV